MTPAIKLIQKQQLPFQIHQYRHDKSSESYGLEAASKIGADPKQVFKTLVVSLDNTQLVVAILPVVARLSMKQIAKVFGAKKAAMADPHEVLRSTGYVLGGVSPLAQKKRLKTALDKHALNYATIYVSAGKRGLDIELKSSDLIALLNATCADLCC
ncbi:MAG: Cys-tRNA(Pro)/Cys-tRNA(Cys) deacylase [Psychromonas sp.]|jgi:Cys-tRNA(Pro)/Cys-tRNA(Cys) deacylase|uniref:Cys-tRNA(Pro) deacylase n=1 Tax=Psychromonas sp. TaxID=1884585 RepID=UPI0039E6E37F